MAHQLQEQFLNPERQYGPLSFYWWAGEPLDLDRITWQLDRLQENGFYGVNVNYTHTVTGSNYLGRPELFSDAWWELWEKTTALCEQRGMIVGFDDYMITFGHPELSLVGSEIRRQEAEVTGLILQEEGGYLEKGQALDLDDYAGETILSLHAYRVIDDKLSDDDRIDLLDEKAGDPAWRVPEGRWYFSAVSTRAIPFGVMNRRYTEKVLECYFERFKKRSGGRLGGAVNYFFQDELNFGGYMPYWSEQLSHEFSRVKGYDLLPHLTALFKDTGALTPKVRLDYYDVAVGLMEECYFKPIYDWCEKNNLRCAHDQIGRCDPVVGTGMYGDYFRTMRWYQVPGTDRIPELFRGKVCASIAQLYSRPRVWLECYHSTGWGVTPQDISRWDSEALMFGYNLIAYHSLYYTTLGGWWDWAGGDLHFRQPYWSMIREYYLKLTRLCAVLSQGKHRCDIAVLYPTSTVQADMEGAGLATGAQNPCRQMDVLIERMFKEHGLDFDFIDDHSLKRARVEGGRLCVAGGRYRALILPATEHIRWTSLQQLQAFWQQGGIAVAFGAVPTSSDRRGRDDADLAAVVKEVFGVCGGEESADESTSVTRNDAGGCGFCVGPGETDEDVAESAKAAIAFIEANLDRDFRCRDGRVWVMHRTMDELDVYAVYNPEPVEVMRELQFRVADRTAQEWHAERGDVRELTPCDADETSQIYRCVFQPHELKLIAFLPLAQSGRVEDLEAEGPETGEGREVVPVEGAWTFQVEPTLDNRWGDFVSPATDEKIPPTVRTFRYREQRVGEDVSSWHLPEQDDGAWSEVRTSYGPRFRVLGPVSAEVSAATMEQVHRSLESGEAGGVTIDGREYPWKPYRYSLRWGKEEDPFLVERSGIAIHGPIGYVPEEFLHFQTDHEGDTWFLATEIVCDAAVESRVGVGTGAAVDVWVNGERALSRPFTAAESRGAWRIVHYPSCAMTTAPIRLRAGVNSLLVRLQGGAAGSIIRGFAVAGKDLKDQLNPAEHPANDPHFIAEGLAASRWYHQGGLHEYDIHARNRPQALWYRFDTPPGLREMELVSHGRPAAWVEGRELEVSEMGEVCTPAVLHESATAYRLSLDQVSPAKGSGVLCIQPRPGYYGGAAIPEPIKMLCGEGETALADWCDLGLSCYSGCVRYSKAIRLEEPLLRQRIWLNLGKVRAVARVWVNDTYAGCLYEEPWRIEITSQATPGLNTIVILVANTLANHYSEGMPCDRRYVFEGQTESGLLGPVQIEAR